VGVKFGERYWPLFEQKAWACSATEVEWRKQGFDGSSPQAMSAINRFLNRA
jgi:hypothetical protein